MTAKKKQKVPLNPFDATTLSMLAQIPMRRRRGVFANQVAPVLHRLSQPARKLAVRLCQ